jgi:hypothetical protein
MTFHNDSFLRSSLPLILQEFGAVHKIIMADAYSYLHGDIAGKLLGRGVTDKVEFLPISADIYKI